MRLLLMVALVCAGSGFFATNEAAAWNVAGASVYNGCPGAWGDVCGGSGFAELGGSGGVLMGGLAPRTLVRLTYRGRSVDVRKLDWGTGGGAVAGLPRAIDLPCSTANRLGIGDCVNWTGVVRWKLLVRVKRHRGWVPHVPSRTTNAPRERGARVPNFRSGNLSAAEPT